MGARSFPGNPYDGDTLAEQLEQARGLLQDVNVIPQVAIVDLGYRGRDVEGVQILHRGKAKTLTRRQWRWIKRRQAVEPVIGHLKQDCRLNRCHLKGAQGDALHVLGCAAGDNLRWLLRWIAFLRAWLQVVRARPSTRSSTMWPAHGTGGLRGGFSGATNENTNDLLRQFLPKGADLSTVSQEYLNHIALLMNTRPRQTLGWKTPSEAMEEDIAALKSRVALES